MAHAQQQTDAPAFPPSNFELRLQQHQARQERRKAERAERTESRLRRLTGSGETAGSDAAANSAGGLDLGLPVKAIIAGVVALAARAALGDDAADEDGGGGGGGGGSGVTSTVSTN